MNAISVPAGFTRAQLLAAVDRELRLRAHVYPHQVDLGPMSSAKMREEIAVMQAIRAVIAQLPEEPPAQAGLFEEHR